MTKRYYWLKLHRDFFKRHDTRIIESMDNGKDYLLFYLKLLVESIDHEGTLRFSTTIPYNESMLATITNTNIDIVRSALKVLKELGMLEVMDDDTLYMTTVESMIGSEVDSAKRVRAHREKQALLQCNGAVTNSNTELEIDIEKDKEKKERLGEHVRLTPTEYQRLLTDYGERVTAEYVARLDDYVGSKGKRYKSHYHTIRSWLRKDKVVPRPAPKVCPKCGEEYAGNFCRKPECNSE